MSFGDWLEERTGYRAVVRHALDEPVAGGARWAYVFGSALTISLVLQAVTGWLLMSAYAPSATTAWASVAHISFALSGGWIVRGLHHFGAQAMVVVLGMHVAQTALFGAYKKPREINWYLGLGLLAVTLGFALTGYLLPWDQKGYWATRVATNIVGSLPLLGGALQRLVVGGSEYGHLTLTHFYTLHVGVLPAATVLLLVLHIALFRKHGVTPPQGADLAKVDKFYPKQVWKDLAFGLLILGVVFALAIREHGAPLDAPADPASDYPARPEWYFLALFEMLKYFQGSLEPVGAIGVPLVVGGFLVALPLLDKGEDRSPRARAKYLVVLAVIGLAAAALTGKAMSADASDQAFQKARVEATKRADRAAELSRKGVPPEGPLAMLKNDPETRGEELFKTSCASCHRLGELGPAKGKETAPDLTGWGTKAWLLALFEDPDRDDKFGKSCFKGNMLSLTHPPKDPKEAADFKPVSTADQATIAQYLEAQARGEEAKGTPGEKLVSQRCTSCHRLHGETLVDDSLGPELAGWASQKWIEAQIANPGNDKVTYPKGAMAEDLKGHMPRFDDKLTEGDISLLARWLISKR